MYPYGRVLAWSDNFLAPATLAFFFRQLGANFVESVNLVNLFVTFLNGFITYSYLRTISPKVSALWGGVMMQGLPFLALHLGHPQLQIVFIFPLALMILNLKSTFKAGVLLGALLGFSFLYGVYLAYFLGLFIFFFIRKEHLIGLALSSIIFLPFLYPYYEVSKAFRGRELYEGFPFKAEPLSFIASSHVFYKGLFEYVNFEAQLFTGFAGSIGLLFGIISNFRVIALFALVICLILIQINYLWITLLLPSLFFFSKEKRLSLALLFFLSLSFGSAFGHYSLHRLFSYLVPGLISLRAIGRLGIVVVFFLVLLATKLAPRKLMWILLPLTLIELSFVKLTLKKFIPNEVGFDKEIALVLPYSGPVKEDGTIASWREFAYYQGKAVLTFPGKSIVNGYSGLQGELTEKLAGYFFKFPEPVSARAAKSIVGLTHIYIKNSVKVDWLGFDGEERDYYKYRLLDVDFPGRGTFLAPPYQDEIKIIWKANKNCKVEINKNEVSLGTEFSEVRIRVNPRKVKLTEVPFRSKDCDTITVRETR